MSKEEVMKIRGRVVQAVGNGAFKVCLEGTDTVIHCTLKGKMRKNRIFVIVDDYVDLILSLYNLELGMISFRHKKCPEGYKNEATN